MDTVQYKKVQRFEIGERIPMGAKFLFSSTEVWRNGEPTQFFYYEAPIL